jgi:tetratricopeptide (TPR) repeat protein
MMLLLCCLVAFAGTPVVLPASEHEVVFEDDVAPVVEAALDDLAAQRYAKAAVQLTALAEAGQSPDAWYLTALARYQGGDLRLAQRALERGVAARGDHGPLLALQGLVLADRGRGDEALAVLDKAGSAARSASDGTLAARVELNRGVVYMDRGAVAEARTHLTAAREMASRAGDQALVALADENLGTLDATAAADVVGTVSAHLRAGNARGAMAAIPIAAEWDRRGRVRAAIATALVQRAEGKLDQAASTLRVALPEARQGGLLRETAAILAQLGTVYSLAGRFRVAMDMVQEAVGLVEGTSFRVVEVNHRVEAGRIAVRLDDLPLARAQLTAASKVETSDPMAGARLAELEGTLAAWEGKVAPASAAYERALGVWEAAGHTADAARVSTDLVELYAGRDKALTRKWVARSEKLFASLGNPVGPAHVQIALDLGAARRGEIETALEAFVRAAEVGDAAGSERGTQIARIARQNAASALAALGHSEEAAAHAREHGLGGVLERQASLAKAEQAYQSGMEAYAAGDLQSARSRFDEAWKAFTSLEEEGYALTARKARAWATWNLAVAQEPVSARTLYRELIGEAEAVGDPELLARSLGAEALARVELGVEDVLDPLRHAANAAEEQGLDGVAARCHAAIAELDEDLGLRVDAARRAFDLAPLDDQSGAYAMYAVSVQAYNAGAYDLAHDLAVEVLPRAGSLEEAVAGVRDAALAER